MLYSCTVQEDSHWPHVAKNFKFSSPVAMAKFQGLHSPLGAGGHHIRLRI